MRVQRDQGTVQRERAVGRIWSERVIHAGSFAEIRCQRKERGPETPRLPAAAQENAKSHAVTLGRSAVGLRP